jgi:hypothetical protein
MNVARGAHAGAPLFKLGISLTRALWNVRI